MSKKETYLADAEFLYLKGNTLEQVSLVTGVSVNSLSKWKNEHGWDEKRKKLMKQPLALADMIGEALGDLVRKMLDSVRAGQSVPADLADSISKLSAVRKSLGSTEDLGAMVILVTEKLSKFAQGYLKEEKDRAVFSETLAAFYQDVKEKSYV